MVNLSKCKIGKIYEIENISNLCPMKIKRRLYDLGFLNKTKIKVLKKSLFGGVLLLEMRGYILSLKKSIAVYINLGG